MADRIAHGPIAVEEVLPIARQIAEALEAAHEQGIIHRDLKPANIKVRVLRSRRSRSYDVSTDGRFLMIERALAPGGAEGTGLVVVLNRGRELKRRLPAQP